MPKIKHYILFYDYEKTTKKRRLFKFRISSEASAKYRLKYFGRRSGYYLKEIDNKKAKNYKITL